MIFLGDIASPDLSTSASLDTFFQSYEKIFKDKRVVCNFEGLINNDSRPDVNEPILYNHSSIIKVLNRGQEPVFCLANNHTLDLPKQFEFTTGLLKEEDIIFTGAGRSRKEAEMPAVISEGDKEVILFNCCWDFLLYNHLNPRSGIYVAEINETRLIKRIKEYKEKDQSASIVVFLHWSLDLETLPFPMCRQFARDVIEAGAGLVVGSHSHCVQGGERYKEGYIVYGLGNFFIPHHHFINGKLVYPGFSKTEMALEWDPEKNIAICHWFSYLYQDGSHQLIYLESDHFENSQLLKEYSPFAGMTDKEYLAYFKKNRRKKILIPVYTDYHKKVRNFLNTHILKDRAHIARLLAKINIIKWQN